MTTRKKLVQLVEGSAVVGTDFFAMVVGGFSRKVKLDVVRAALLSAVAVPSYDIVFAIAAQTAAVGFVRAGGPRTLNMSRYAATLGTLARKVRFVATLENAVHSVAYNAEIHLWDVTHGVLVANTTLDNTSAVDRAVAAEYTSPVLTVGAAAGNIRSDAPALYVAELRAVGAIPLDERVLGTARIEITYETP